nr:ribonuclease H-like domain-containing protein [Tanacetum cinerariifolium]
MFENRVNSPSFSGRTVPLFPSMLVTIGEGSCTLTEPHHTPTPEATPSPHHELSSSSLPPAIIKPTPTIIPSDNPPLSDEFPLLEQLPTANEDKFPLLIQSDATCSIHRLLSVTITLSNKVEDPILKEHQVVSELEFGDSYKAPKDDVATGLTTEGTGKKKGITVALTTEDMQKRKNDVKYGNIKAEVSETMEQTFNRLHAIVSHLEFMDIEIEQDDWNQKFLTSLPPEWLMHTIVWRNRSEIDTMRLDDLYNHLKVYESEVKKKSDSNSQNMAFISSAKNSSEKEEVNTASIPTARGLRRR